MPRKGPVLLRPIPVDGGWGWMVVFGSFIIHVIADGFVYSFGIMVVQLLNTFHEGRGLTSWIVSTLIGLTLGTGPLASAVTHRFGCRATTMAGALIASCGCALSFFATNVVFLMMTIGVIMGLGFGLMYCPAIVIVTMYFEERRAFATGIAVCGAGIGTFIFAPLTTYLIDMYAWRGAFLIYAGFILNCVVCGAVFRPLEFEEVYPEDMELKEVETAGGSLEAIVEDNGNPEIPDLSEAHEKLKMENGVVVSLEALDKPTDRFLQQHRFRTYSHTNTNVASPVKQLSRAASVIDNAKAHARHRRRGQSESTGYLAVKDVFYRGSVRHLAGYQANHDQYRSILSIPKAESVASLGFDATVDTSNEFQWTALSVIQQMIDFSLLKDPVFLLFTISNFLTSMGLNPPLVFLPDRANIQLGITQHRASWLVSAFGISNTVGRVIVGFIADRPMSWLGNAGQDLARNRLWIYNLMLLLCGCATILSTFCKDFTSLMIYALIYGFTLSAYICLISVLLVDLLGLERLTSAFGMLLLFQGIASLIGSPIAGWIIDAWDSYDYCFYFSGLSILLSGIVCSLVPFVPGGKNPNSFASSNNKNNNNYKQNGL